MKHIQFNDSRENLIGVCQSAAVSLDFADDAHWGRLPNYTGRLDINRPTDDVVACFSSWKIPGRDDHDTEGYRLDFSVRYDDMNRPGVGPLGFSTTVDVSLIVWADPGDANAEKYAAELNKVITASIMAHLDEESGLGVDFVIWIGMLLASLGISVLWSVRANGEGIIYAAS